jgi:hypothetical protein
MEMAGALRPLQEGQMEEDLGPEIEYRNIGSRLERRSPTSGSEGLVISCAEIGARQKRAEKGDLRDSLSRSDFVSSL